MRDSRSDGLRCDFSANKLTIPMSNMSLYTRNITNIKLTFKQYSPWYQLFKQALCEGVNGVDRLATKGLENITDYRQNEGKITD